MELGNDWVINDALGIGSGTIFPQLENLKDFANNYIALGGHIDVGIGQSMMGVGMSALAFTKGFENINFRTYSGCLSYDLLHTLEQDPDWGLNNLNGSNLQSFTNANEPLTQMYEPVKRDNKIYMLENTDASGFAAHGVDTYFSKDNSSVSYREIEHFDRDAYPLWDTEPRFSYGKAEIGNGFELSINIKIGSKHTAANLASDVTKFLDNNVDCSLKVKDNDAEYNVYNKQDTIYKLQCTNKDLDNYNTWLKESSSDDDAVFLDLSNSQNQIKVPPSFVKSTDISHMYEGVSSDLKGEYTNPDIRLPEGSDLHLPSQGNTDDPIKYEYTTKPEMLSNIEQAYIALSERNYEKFREIVLNRMSASEKDQVPELCNNPRLAAEIAAQLAQNLGNIYRPENNIIPNFSTDVSAKIVNIVSGKVFSKPMAIDLDGDGLKTVGLVISHKNNEKRRALLPEDLNKIQNLDYLYLEQGYGESIGLKDSDYSGVNFVSREKVLECDVIVDVKLGDADYLETLEKGKILCGWAHAAQNISFTTSAIKNEYTVIAWENIFKNGRYIFYKNREIAGEAAILQGIRYAEKVPYELNVAIIGNGQTAKGALRVLHGLGANVDVYNRRLENAFKKNMYNYDVLVNCVLWDTNRSDRLIYKEDLKKMKPGTLIIDVSCDPYLEIETSHPTTIDNPVYEVDGVIHYAVDNTPAMFPKSVSRVLSSNFISYFDELVTGNFSDEIKKATVIENGNILDKEIINFRKVRGVANALV